MSQIQYFKITKTRIKIEKLITEYCAEYMECHDNKKTGTCEKCSLWPTIAFHYDLINIIKKKEKEIDEEERKKC